MLAKSLVQPAFDGPLDIVADVHGEVDALYALLAVLGYSETGIHPEGRRLIFLGDLIDRGPDSPAVVELVSRYVEVQHAQCVLGNHELNILRGERKLGNAWFFGETESLQKGSPVTPQNLADNRVRDMVIQFFATLPIALEREDLRIVHACWDGPMVERARKSGDALALYTQFKLEIESRLTHSSTLDDVDRNLAYQNGNAVKVLTSGWEKKVAEPFEAAGKVRLEARAPWWSDYSEDVFCVFGHYGRLPGAGGEDGDNLFNGSPFNAVLSNGCAMCIDYGMAKRWKERLTNTVFGTRLAALRFLLRQQN
jgi:hypothetical protein